MDESLPTQMERLRGDFRALDTAVRMHISEQHRINEHLSELLSRHEEKLEKLDTRIQATERRMAWYAGGTAALVGAWEVFKTVLRGS
ncbi:MAG: hypothetical protein HY760_00535 [Nitrospirae bacterium]|nr:hypothetical protein [Nitrospirota bacterium]